MSYLDDSAGKIVEAFEEDNLHKALDLLCGSLWNVTETLPEMIALTEEVETHLRREGNEREADFCRDLLPFLKGHEGTMSTQAFVERMLRVTGWAKPSPAKAARQYIENRETVARVGRVLLQAAAEVQADRARARRERIREENRRFERRENIKAVAGKAGLAVLTGGMSLLFPFDD